MKCLVQSGVAALILLPWVMQLGSAEQRVVKESKRIGEEGKVFVFRESLYLRPLFYKGAMPLVYEAGRRLSGLYAGMVDIVYWHRFDGWRNEFSYDELLILNTIEARDSNDKLLAQAERVEIQKDKKRIVYREKHCGSDGDVDFECLSAYGVDAGFKLEEKDTHCRKKHEYFFILPV